MADDIFKGDKKFDATPKEESFGSALKHIGKGLGVILFKKFYMNLFVVVLVIAASSLLTYYVKPGITGAAVVECPNITCPEVEECACEQQECPELNCDDCPEKTLTEYVYRYRCPNGAIVNNADQCEEEFPQTNPDYTSTSNGVSLSLDSIYYEKENDTVKIKQINYTIINRGTNNILPKVGLKSYEEYTFEVKQEPYIRTFELGSILYPNEWVKKAESVIIAFKGNKRTVRLELINTLPDPDENIATVYREFDFP